jgi:hypothetical protein
VQYLIGRSASCLTILALQQKLFDKRFKRKPITWAARTRSNFAHKSTAIVSAYFDRTGCSGRGRNFTLFNKFKFAGKRNNFWALDRVWFKSLNNKCAIY